MFEQLLLFLATTPGSFIVATFTGIVMGVAITAFTYRIEKHQRIKTEELKKRR